MRYTDEYRNPDAARGLVATIRGRVARPIRIMEFCGGHTHAIMRYGIRQALSPHLHMLSGPGCPVCVTPDGEIDYAIALAHLPGLTVATFGDMIRVPGSRSSLQEARAAGADVRIVYSALDALEYAQEHPGRSVVMLGIGFETTAPGVAASLLQARELGIGNYFVYSMHKLTPPAMRAILDAGEVRLDAILGPGHVTTIIGANAWSFLAQDYRIPCAVSGFEPLDILRALSMLADAVRNGNPQVANAYPRSVTSQGNTKAQLLMKDVFETCAVAWRGLGEIPSSGLKLRQEYAAHDARLAFDPPSAATAATLTPAERGCRCGEVLRGVAEPPECPLFGGVCTPARPIGACMVSAEGSCAAHYRYGGSLD